MSLNNRTLKLFLLVNLFACALTLANAKGVCPARAKEKVEQIDIFDGKPEELAYLAPDDDETAPNAYTLKHIYEKGRIVTIRCKYNSGFVYEIEFKNKVDQCEFSRNKSGDPTLICK